LVFSNLFFLYFFLPALFLVYIARKNAGYRNWVLILFSFLFYAWGEPVWVALLAFCGVTGYYFGRWIDANRDGPKGKWLLGAAVALNLSLLGFFKYIDFLIGNVNALLPVELPYVGVALPIGISFFTFQMISYLIDVYRGDIRTPTSLTKVLLYLSLFPQLIAGPIVRYTDIQHEMENRRFRLASFSEGVSRFVIGLGKKVILANTAGELVPVFMDGSAGEMSVLGAWFGITLYALQIYFDFSGYSDMAIGLGKMFGFTYPENFRYPYVSRSATDFWRRWNMSLGSFFRDYVYIPLGGNRRLQLRNLFVVWFLTGLWHGASWNFVVWGLYFFVLLLLEKSFLLRWMDRLPRFASHAYFVAVMLIGWVFFYFTDLGQAGRYLGAMFGLSGQPLLDTRLEIYFFDNLFFWIIAIIAATPLPSAVARKAVAALSAMRPLRAVSVYAQPVYHFVVFLCSTTLLVGSTYNPFLYFRF